MTFILDLLITALIGIFAITSFLIADKESRDRKKERRKNP
jgi:hypothetical protein